MKAARRKPGRTGRRGKVEGPAPARKTAAPHKASAGAQPRPFAGALAGSSEKQRLLFEMVRARVAVHAALQALPPSVSEERTGPGRKWTVREQVLHLCHRDLEANRALESALHGVAPSWADFDRDETDRFNAEGLGELRHLAWEDAHQLLLKGRNELMAALDSISEEPANAWSPEHPLGAMLLDLAGNDRHHADIIKRWRTERGV